MNAQNSEDSESEIYTDNNFRFLFIYNSSQYFFGDDLII